MRKLLLLFCILSFVFSAHAKDEMPKFNIVDGKITYTEVISLDSSLTKSDLYMRARAWFSKAYKSSNNVIQMEDKDAGIIIGKALLGVEYRHWLYGMIDGGDIHYTISIYLKDGKYKYEITDFYHTGNSANGIADGGSCEDMMTSNVWGRKGTYFLFLNRLDSDMLLLIDDLKSSMKTGTGSIKSDW